MSSKPFLDLDRMFFAILSRQIFFYLTLTQFYRQEFELIELLNHHNSTHQLTKNDEDGIN
jgi:hypothetical protein